MKTKIKHLTAILLFFTLIACDSWLELIPPSGLIREEFWKTKEDVEAVLMGAYETMASMDNLFFLYGELRADLIKGDNNQDDSQRKMAESNIYPDNYLCNWESFYKVINYCNDVLKNAPLVQQIDKTFTDFKLNGIIAEATFLRSLCYFYLVRLYKDVPLVLTPTETDDTDFYLPQTPGDEILKRIAADLEQTRNYAASDSYTTLAEIKGRASKAAFDALLADISLWNFEYEKCINYHYCPTK